MFKLYIIIILVFTSLEMKTINVAEETVFDIQDYKWLVGTWRGDGFGGISEETWMAPIDGTMMGMYRHYKDGKINFYEFLLLDETGLKLKHFHPDLKAWETKDEMVVFPMVEFSKTKITLKGLTYELKSELEMEINLKLEHNGKVETEVFTMKKVENIQ